MHGQAVWPLRVKLLPCCLALGGQPASRKLRVQFMHMARMTVQCGHIDISCVLHSTMKQFSQAAEDEAFVKPY